MINAEHTFRQFALAVYRNDGVPPASILLQDRCAVDVNVLLLAAYVGAARGAVFTHDDLAEAGLRIGRWQMDVVQPLRAVRGVLKDGPPPAPNPMTAELRERVKALELDAEMVELDDLALIADGLGGTAAEGAAHTRAAAAMDVVVHDGVAREPTDEEREAITLIARAAARYVEGG